jgi:hypothetical protein
LIVVPSASLAAVNITPSHPSHTFDIGLLPPSSITFLIKSNKTLKSRGTDLGDSTQMFAGYSSKKRINERYKIVGFISSGTYGRVYKAEGKNGRIGEFAIKKYDPVKSA